MASLARLRNGQGGADRVNVLLDTHVLSEPLRERPDPAVMAQLESEEHVLHTASVVIHELSYGIHRLPSWRGRADPALGR